MRSGQFIISILQMLANKRYQSKKSFFFMRVPPRTAVCSAGVLPCVMPACYRVFRRVLPRVPPRATRVLPAYYRVFRRVLPRGLPRTAACAAACYRVFRRVLPRVPPRAAACSDGVLPCVRRRAAVCSAAYCRLIPFFKNTQYNYQIIILCVYVFAVFY